VGSIITPACCGETRTRSDPQTALSIY